MYVMYTRIFCLCTFKGMRKLCTETTQQKINFKLNIAKPYREKRGQG